MAWRVRDAPSWGQPVIGETRTDPVAAGLRETDAPSRMRHRRRRARESGRRPVRRWGFVSHHGATIKGGPRAALYSSRSGKTAALALALADSSTRRSWLDSRSRRASSPVSASYLSDARVASASCLAIPQALGEDIALSIIQSRHGLSQHDTDPSQVELIFHRGPLVDDLEPALFLRASVDRCR